MPRAWRELLADTTHPAPPRFPALQATKCATDLTDANKAKDDALAAQATAEAAATKCATDLTDANKAKDDALAAQAAAEAAEAQCQKDLTASQGTVRWGQGRGAGSLLQAMLCAACTGVAWRRSTQLRLPLPCHATCMWQLLSPGALLDC